MIEEEKNQEQKTEQPDIGNNEPIIKQEKPIFLIEDAKNIAIETERRMGRIESFQKKVAEIFNPLMNKFKGNDALVNDKKDKENEDLGKNNIDDDFVK